jgi:hypothetical protein
MRVRIISYEDVNGWILGKFARRLQEHLSLQGALVDIADSPDASADINHHIIYLGYDGRKTTTETLMITHVDTDWKIEMVRKQMVNAEMGICMSADTHRKLVRAGIPRHKLCYVNPAHDHAFRPRKTLIGLTTRVYLNGCKREQMLLQLADRISAEQFRFFIMGSGWAPIVDALRQRGIEVDYYDDFDNRVYGEMLPRLDYYLYLGQDEGSMGFVDALCAGVATIVTPQGFHLDASDGIAYSFNDLEELVNVFNEISEHKNRLPQAVEAWTWPEYARKHLAIWDYLLRKKNSTFILREQKRELKSLSVVRYETLSNLNAGLYRGINRMKPLSLKIQSFLHARTLRLRRSLHYRTGIGFFRPKSAEMDSLSSRADGLSHS